MLKLRGLLNHQEVIFIIMNAPKSRRQFLEQVGKGTLLATIGPALAAEFGISSSAIAGEAGRSLDFGAMEPLVRFMQETPIGQLQSGLHVQLKEGVDLKRLVAAGVLANARTFGGEDYIGFHTLMALGPSLQMSHSMPQGQNALPVFKVLYRNTNRIQENGGRSDEVLHPLPPVTTTATATPAAMAAQLHEAVKRKDKAGAEKTFAAIMSQSADAGFNALLECVQDDTEVHRTVLPYRAWDLLNVVGHEHATTMLRMSLRYCLDAESRRRPEWDEHARVLTKLLDEHKLLGREPGKKTLDDAELEKLTMTIFSGSPSDAAGAVAAALAEGICHLDVGEAISLAANQIVLRDRGRPPEWEAPGKPPGSVHGDSIGVHITDSVHAWRNLSEVSQGRNVFACLILAAWQVGRDRGLQPFMEWKPSPSDYQLRTVTAKDQAVLLADLEAHIRGNLQGHASAVVHRWGQLGLPPEPIFQLLLRYAVSEDGALHAEKYYQTCWDEFHRTRPAYRWRHLVSLARVTTSEFGRPAPGQEEARKILGV